MLKRPTLTVGAWLACLSANWVPNISHADQIRTGIATMTAGNKFINQSKSDPYYTCNYEIQERLTEERRLKQFQVSRQPVFQVLSQLRAASKLDFTLIQVSTPLKRPKLPTITLNLATPTPREVLAAVAAEVAKGGEVQMHAGFAGEWGWQEPRGFIAQLYVGNGRWKPVLNQITVSGKPISWTLPNGTPVSVTIDQIVSGAGRERIGILLIPNDAVK